MFSLYLRGAIEDGTFHKVLLSFTETCIPDKLKDTFTTYFCIVHVGGSASKYVCEASGKGFKCKHLSSPTELWSSFPIHAFSITELLPHSYWNTQCSIFGGVCGPPVLGSGLPDASYWCESVGKTHRERLKCCLPASLPETSPFWQVPFNFVLFNVFVRAEASFAFWGLMNDSGQGGSFVMKGKPSQLTVSNAPLMPVRRQNHHSLLSSIPLFLFFIPCSVS